MPQSIETTGDNSSNLLRDIFLARQPIYDRSLNVYAYEVLFRSSTENRAAITDGNQATSQLLLNAFVNIGLDEIVGDRFAFVNLTREFLTGEFPLPLAADRLVLEILEDVAIDADLVAGVRHLIDQGYRLALDDVTFEERLIPLLELTQIVKVELPKIPRGQWRQHLARFRQYNVQVLAEKIETQADFELCRELGFDFFQGYFLAKPQMIAGKQPTSSQTAVLQLMSQLNQPNVTVDDLENILKGDAKLSFKLLRYINSAKFGLRRRVDSLRQGIVLLGIQGVRTLTMLVALSNISSDRPQALKLAMLRALTCEKLGAKVSGCDGSACFMAGLVSMLESVLGIPLPKLLTLLPVSDAIRTAVTEHQGQIGDILRCAILFEEVHQPPQLCQGLSAEQARTAYLTAISETERLWSDAQ